MPICMSIIIVHLSYLTGDLKVGDQYIEMHKVIVGNTLWI